MALASARHRRHKIERLMFPPRLSAAWLGPLVKIGPGRGRKSRRGHLNFSVQRRTEYPIGRGPEGLAKMPYHAQVCIGKTNGKMPPPGPAFREHVGCSYGAGATPTKALGSALKNLGALLSRRRVGR